MWEHMSKILHNLENCLSLQAMGQLDCRLVQVYNELWANTLSNHDMYLVRLPLPRLLQRVISYRWEWLTLAEVVLRTYNCQTRQWNDTIQHMMRGMRSQMRGWLQSRMWHSTHGFYRTDFLTCDIYLGSFRIQHWLTLMMEGDIKALCAISLMY